MLFSGKNIIVTGATGDLASPSVGTALPSGWAWPGRR
jgi:hypothetical protein